MPSVPWSSVPGPRSKGYDREKTEDADKTHDIVVEKMTNLGMTDCFVITDYAGEVFKRTRI
jgi:hypothetical protein